jgi:hypothetical protein
MMDEGTAETWAAIRSENHFNVRNSCVKAAR